MTAKDRIAQDPTVLDPSRPIPASEDRLAAGTVVGDFVVERHIGAGAMGDVYAARHPVIGKRVAVKVIKRELAARADSAERFLREARAVNQIDHPNVVDVFALGRLDDGRLYLVMDLLDGESLRERLRAGPVAPTVALAILGQIADALDVAHGKGVVHRDLKPDNVFVTGPADRPTAHVLDFGIAKLLADAGGERVVETLTGQGAWLGTPAYMAPEQWSADGASGASDRYALGILAYELLTGKVPFQATTLPGMMEQHFRAAVPSVTSTGAALSPALDRVFARALAKEPDDRHPTAAALVAELAAGLGGKAARSPRAARSGRTPWLAIGAAGLVAVAGGAIVLGGVGRARTPSADPSHASDRGAATASVQVTSRPAGARVRRGDAELGVTPLLIDAAPGETVRVELAKAGYATVERTAVAAAGEPARIDAELAIVAGFEGVWALPEGQLRAFERRGEQVAGFRLDAARGPRQFLRFFAFVPADGAGVAFTASEPHVDERAPDEPSCHLELHAEYRYQPATDALSLRKQRAHYALVDGRCVLDTIDWGEPKALARVEGAPADAVYAESRAGAGPQVVDPPADNANDSKADVPNQDDAALDQKPIQEPIEPPTKPVPKKGPKKLPANLKQAPAPPTGKGKPAANATPFEPPTQVPPAQAPVPQASQAKAPPAKDADPAALGNEQAQAQQRMVPTRK